MKALFPRLLSLHTDWERRKGGKHGCKCALFTTLWDLHVLLSALENFWDSPVGLQSGAIKNSQITASSEANTNLAAWLARLHNVPKGGRKGAWCSRYNNYNQWIQVDFRKAMILTGIAIQGRQDYDQWMTAFYVRYSMDGVYFSEIKNWWNAYVKVWIAQSVVIDFTKPPRLHFSNLTETLACLKFLAEASR